MKNGNENSSELMQVAARTIYQMTCDKHYKRGHILTPEDALVEAYYRASQKKVKRLKKNGWRVLQILRQEYPSLPWGIHYVGNKKNRGTVGWCIDNEKTAVVTENINTNLQTVHEPRILAFRKALTDGGSAQLLIGGGSET